MQGVSKLMRNILRGDFSAKIKGGFFHIIFCSKPLPLQVAAKSSIVTPYGCSPNFSWCNLEWKGF